MKYFLIENTVYENELNIKQLGFPNAVELTLEQRNFKLANPNATLQEIQNLQMNPIVEAEPIVELPSIEERLNLIEEYIIEKELL